ncbi:hypothetical protein FQR65_LT20455 [Abscondita terminalis]|nr:hypothetical protein FQR65_LT20455 [Abscondita terminalis]
MFGVQASDVVDIAAVDDEQPARIGHDGAAKGGDVAQGRSADRAVHHSAVAGLPGRARLGQDFQRQHWQWALGIGCRLEAGAARSGAAPWEKIRIRRPLPGNRKLRSRRRNAGDRAAGGPRPFSPGVTVGRMSPRARIRQYSSGWAGVPRTVLNVSPAAARLGIRSGHKSAGIGLDRGALGRAAAAVASGDGLKDSWTGLWLLSGAGGFNAGSGRLHSVERGVRLRPCAEKSLIRGEDEGLAPRSAKAADFLALPSSRRLGLRPLRAEMIDGVAHQRCVGDWAAPQATRGSRRSITRTVVMRCATAVGNHPYELHISIRAIAAHGEAEKRACRPIAQAATSASASATVAIWGARHAPRRIEHDRIAPPTRWETRERPGDAAARAARQRRYPSHCVEGRVLLIR